jgi:lipopolysaccharide export system permease protein
MMKILDRYLLRELAAPFLFGVAAFVGLFVASNLLTKLTELVAEQGISFGQAALLFIYWLPGFVVYTFPMAALLAVLLTYGRLSAESEIIAARAGGVSLTRLARPALGAALAVSLFTFAFSETVVPRASRAAQDVLLAASQTARSAVRERVVMRILEDGQTRRVIYADRFAPKQELLEGVTVVEFASGQPTLLFKAARATWRGSEWTLLDGYSQKLGPDQLTATILFPRQDFDLGASPDELAMQEKKPDQMTFLELRRYATLLERQGTEVAELMVSLHNKVAIPFACLVFALIGVPLGIRSPRGGSSIGIGLSVLIIFLYYVIWHYLAVFAQQAMFPAFWAAWLPNLFGGGLGAALLVRASR